ncbi:MAG: ATP-dependent Clp protease ATP-binding subunit [Eubacterium sp.]|nr:ATP-dependent Clp protease ATP-binding subunit [Eubacterium sp.]
MSEQYTAQAATALQYAKELAHTWNHGYIGTEHILAGLIREGKGTAAMVLSEAGVQFDKLTELIDVLIAPDHQTDTLIHPEYTPKAEQLLKDAALESARLRSRKTGTEHLLLALLKEPESVALRLLFTLGIDLRELFVNLLRAIGRNDQEIREEADMMASTSGEAGGTPTLDQYSRDLTVMARQGKLDPVIGRETEISRVIQILSRRMKNNPCLIGEPGVGKTAIVEGLAAQISAGDVPVTVRDKRVVVLDLSGMVAGSKYRGEFEQRIKNVIQEVMENKNILLFVDEIHTMIGAGGAEGALDASNILKPSLSRGEIQLIGATTIEEYRKYIEKDAALERRFQPVTVEEPTEEHAREILRGLRPYYEAHHDLKISDGALDAAVRMSVRYLNDRFLPDKAIDLVDETSSRVRLEGFHITGRAAEQEKQEQELITKEEFALRGGDIPAAKEYHARLERLRKKDQRKKQRNAGEKQKEVTAEDIARTVSIWTKIPLEKIAESESRRLSRLEDILHRRVVGQDEAVSAVARAVRRGRVGLKDPGRPVGSFLFLGPTGVGKTELSKALAEAVFGSENAMIRVDMSEYMEKHSVSKLIGSPPGYVGYDEGGQLSEKIRRNPYSVVLFDEIEKAHPDVFNILLQVLDDGHITDAQGRRVSFKETCIIMTSNAGASRIIQPKHLGFESGEDEARDYQHMKEQVLDELQRIFKPEFLNRIDETIVFHALTRDHMNAIVSILLKDLNRRCKEQMGITLRLTEKSREKLIRDSYDSKYGARPLKRAIQTMIEDPLAEKILSGALHRDRIITIGVRQNQFTWNEK